MNRGNSSRKDASKWYAKHPSSTERLGKVKARMVSTRLRLFTAIAVLAGSGLSSAWGRDLKITLPRHSELTPVQRLNREGVEAVRKHQYEKAEGMFYKAYLYDPADPFTLNNLGYIAELQGDLDRAQKYYKLAAEQGNDAYIDRSSAHQLEGKQISYAFTGLEDVPMRVNRMNVDAIDLLSQERNLEADSLLRSALALDPRNPFTLNNLGVTSEALGDYDSALDFYHAAAKLHSSEPIVIAVDRSWRGKPVSKMAAESAKHLQERLKHIDTAEARAAMLSVRGVSATNRNDWNDARQDFLKAYSLDPYSAFTLNNLGYIAEHDGDLETAHFFYDRAKKADDANARVGLATQREAEGKHLLIVATDSGEKVDDQIDENQALRRERGTPIQLKHRDNSPVTATPPSKPSPSPASSGDQAPQASPANPQS